MSGGHFDYAQYRIDDIADSIEREIEAARKPKPQLGIDRNVTITINPNNQ